MTPKILIAVAIGFAIGAAVGFMYGQGARSRVSDAIKTGYQRGVATVSIDVGRVLLG